MKLTLIVIAVATNTFAFTPEETFSARAGIAIHRLNKTEPCRESRVQCEGNRQIESAFALFAIKPELTHKENQNGYDVFHILIFSAENESLDFAYIYKGNKLTGVRVDRIPSDWELHLFAGDANAVGFLTPNGSFFFNRNNPSDVTFSATEEPRKPLKASQKL